VRPSFQKAIPGTEVLTVIEGRDKAGLDGEEGTVAWGSGGDQDRIAAKATCCANFRRAFAGESRFFLGTNRGKRALALDLKQLEGLAVLHRMVEIADVLVENFRPSVPARLSID